MNEFISNNIYVQWGCPTQRYKFNNRDLFFCIILIIEIYFSVDSNIWFLSDDGSDDNDCHTVRTPCRNLQTVLDRATDGANIYVTSNTLTLLCNHKFSCWINSTISYRLTSLTNGPITFSCRSKHFTSVKLNFIDL